MTVNKVNINIPGIKYGLLDSMTKDLGMTVRVNIDDVRINCLNEAIYEMQKMIYHRFVNSIRRDGHLKMLLPMQVI